MWEMILKGGPVMWPILLGSVIALTIFFEKLYSFQENKVVPLPFFEMIVNLLKENKLTEAKNLCEINNSSLGQICLAGIQNHGKRRELLRSVFEEVGRQEGQKLSRFLNVIGTIASISPLMGLLGTVIGMIKVFQVISIEGVGNAASLSGGISEALITTAAGLSVAIPSIIMYRYCKSRVDQLLSLMEDKAIVLLDLLNARGD